MVLNDLVDQLLIKIVHYADGARGSGLLLEGVPSAQGIGEMEIDHRSVSAQCSPSSMSFTMDTLKKIKQVAVPGMWAANLDFSDTYHHIPIRRSSEVYLCFQVGNRSLRCMVLPLGLSPVP